MSAALKVGHVSHLPIAKLIPDPDQPRQNFDKDGLDELAANIKARGIQMPILVINGGKGKIIIKDGERRWRAAKLAKLKTVPVLLTDAGDDVQRRMDQVAVNQLRESLKPMDLARMLVRLRDDQKLTPNEIQSRLEKDGLQAMSRSQVSNIMRLVDLKPWAQEMLDAGTIDHTAARAILATKDYGPAERDLERSVKQAINWRGRVTVREVEQSVEQAYRHTAIDLQRESSYEKNARIAHFNWKTACKLQDGKSPCQYLKQIGGGAYCLNAREFDKKNDQAKAAGLLPGGKKPQAEKKDPERKLTPAQQRKAEAKKAEEREESLADKCEHYLHANCLARLALRVSDNQDLRRILFDFAALARPGVYTYLLDSHSNRHYRSDLRNLSKKLGRPTIQQFIEHCADQKSLSDMYLEGALQLLGQMPWAETMCLHRWIFGNDLAKFWVVDEAYLDLLRKAELAAVASQHCKLPDGKRSWESLKLDELKAAILAVAPGIPVPPMLAGIYAAEPKFARDYDEDFEDEEDDGEVSRETEEEDE